MEGSTTASIAGGPFSFGGRLAGPASFCRFFHQVSSRHTKRIGDALDADDRRVTNTAFDSAHIGAVQAAFETKTLLRQATRLSQISDVHPKTSPYLHPQISAREMTIGLRTMSPRGSSGKKLAPAHGRKC